MPISADQIEHDQLDRMYQVATDAELPTIDELAERAGLRWTCPGAPEHPHPWTNHEGEPCELCGRSQQQTRRLEAHHHRHHGSIDRDSAQAALADYRDARQLRNRDGFRLARFSPRTRLGRPVFVFGLVCNQADDGGRYRVGDRLSGYIDERFVEIDTERKGAR